MRYEKTVKIIIDKRKLDILIRLDCPKQNIIDLILENKLTFTGDKLIDENLETLIDIKEFHNWGGKRKGSGRPKNNQLENQDENQLENQDVNQLANQDINQVEDKDKDKDININNKTNNTIDIYCNKDFEKIFEMYKEYCNNLTPIIFERRNKVILEKLRDFLEEINYDYDYFKKVCIKANSLKTICNMKIDFKMVINNHIGIMSDKYTSNNIKTTKDYEY